MATGSTLVNHVKTQVPYALLVGFVTTIFGTLFVSFDFYPPVVGSLLSLIVCMIFLFLFGVKSEDADGRSLVGKLYHKLICCKRRRTDEEERLISE